MWNLFHGTEKIRQSTSEISKGNIPHPLNGHIEGKILLNMGTSANIHIHPYFI